MIFLIFLLITINFVCANDKEKKTFKDYSYSRLSTQENEKSVNEKPVLVFYNGNDNYEIYDFEKFYNYHQLLCWLKTLNPKLLKKFFDANAMGRHIFSLMKMKNGFC